MIKIPPCSKTVSNEHRPNFCSPSPLIVVKYPQTEQYIFNQSMYMIFEHELFNNIILSCKKFDSDWLILDNI